MTTPTPPTPPVGPGGELPPGERRTRPRASVTLRNDDARTQSVADLMDPANKSLADALRIAYRLLQGAIVVMVLIYAASGLQKIDEGESGVRVTFGTIESENLSPGLHAAWPAPVGEVIRIATGVQRVDLKRQFFPNLSEHEEKTLSDPNGREQALAGGGRADLDPDADGQLLTGDGSIVHARFLVTYRRTDPRMWLTTIASDDATPDRIEKELVTAAARRGIVHAASRMTIDEVLYNQPETWRQPGEFTPLADLAKVSAQGMLAQLKSGLEIEQIIMTDKMPPRTVMQSFTAVQSAQSAASNEVQKAENDARQRLTEAAGEAAPVILTMIDQYEAQLVSGNRAAADGALARIHDVMMRRPVEMDGKPVTVPVSGKVSEAVSSAMQFRSSVVSRAQADASVFNAKLQAYRTNPSVFLASEWRDAMTSFLNQSNVQTMMLPSNVDRTVIQINRDPDISNMQTQERLLKAQEEAIKKRQREQQRQIHERNIQSAE